MNLKKFLLGLFRGFSDSGELEQVRQVARQDARLIVGAYVDEFETEAALLLTERQDRFAGLLTEDLIKETAIIVQKKTKGRGR